MASETLNSLKLTVTLQGSLSSTATPGLSQTVDYTYEQVFSDGTGNNQAGSVFYSMARALNATNETLDLDNLTILGSAQTDPNAVKLILMRHKSTTASETMSVGGGDFAAASGPFANASDIAVTGPDGLILMVNPRDGWGITATTKDGLLMALSGNSTYDAIIVVDNA